MSADELRRQSALLSAVGRAGVPTPRLRLATGPARSAAAFANWRGNAAAIADKALGSAFPTVRQMLGAPDFARLAAEFRDAAPPRCGDLGEWGGDLPGFIDAHSGLRAWPWLGDTARLDFALHRCSRAGDGRFDAASLEALAQAGPGVLRLVLAPGTEVLESTWPIATIHEAHGADESGAETRFAAVRRALETKHGESVMIAREGWRPTVHRLAQAEVRWLRGLLEGRTLDESLDAAGPGFDFAGWLKTAVRRSWLESVACKDVES